MSPASLETEIIIDKSPEAVKAIFMNWSEFPRWNPFIISMSLTKGDLENATNSFTQLDVSIKVDEKKPMKFTPQLLVNTPGEFRWVGTVLGKWFLAGEHWFEFHPIEDGTKTRFVQGESFTGLGVGLFKLMVSVENTRKGFVAMNEALKKEAETKGTEALSK